PRVVRDPTKRVADFTSLLDFFLPGTSSLDNGTALGFDPLNPGSGGGLGEQDYRRAPNPLILQPTITPVGGGTPIGPAKSIFDVLIRGNVKTDIFSIVGVDSPAEGAAQFSSIINETPGGELANITAASVGTIESNGSIGLSQ